jgi:SAM-dependent methyltransferase
LHLNNGRNLYVHSLLDRLRPVPASSDYLIASGSRALVGKQTDAGWPFELDLLIARKPANLKLRSSLVDDSVLDVAVIGDQGAFNAIDLSLFVRACIRRWPEDRCSLSWPSRLRLAGGDPLNVRVVAIGDRSWLEASHADLRPATQSVLSEVYRYPLDIPWLYDPLDYEVMIPILRAANIRRILDLGCGSGRNAVPLENAGYEVHGVDSAPESIAICRQFVRAPERFLEASAAALPYPDSHFDAMLDIGCLHMLPDRVSRAAVLAEVRRVLKPGGLLCGRALTPRSPDWLAAQPFRSEATGFSPQDITEEAQGLFEPRILGSAEHLTYYKLLKIA